MKDVSKANLKAVLVTLALVNAMLWPGSPFLARLGTIFPIRGAYAGGPADTPLTMILVTAWLYMAGLYVHTGWRFLRAERGSLGEAVKRASYAALTGLLSIANILVAGAMLALWSVGD
jgi:hypothetical protein